MQPIQIEYFGNRPLIAKAVFKTNELLRDSVFYELIAESPQFDMADVSPEKIASLFMNSGISMGIDFYYSLSPLMEVDGFDDVSRPDLLHLNIWRLNRSIPSICNSLVHGCVHALNAQVPEFYFGHGDFRLSGKDGTAPCYIGMLAEQMIEGTIHDNTRLDHDNPAALPHFVKQKMSYIC